MRPVIIYIRTEILKFIFLSSLKLLIFALQIIIYLSYLSIFCLIWINQKNSLRFLQLSIVFGFSEYAPYVQQSPI